jgi:hypothetical protein
MRNPSDPQQLVNPGQDRIMFFSHHTCTERKSLEKDH